MSYNETSFLQLALANENSNWTGINNLNNDNSNIGISLNGEEKKFSVKTRDQINKIINKYQKSLQDKNKELEKCKKVIEDYEKIVNSSKAFIEELYSKNKMLKEKLIKYKSRDY